MGYRHSVVVSLSNAALGLVVPFLLTACSGSDGSPAGDSGPPGPIVGSPGSIRVVENVPASFPPSVFRRANGDSIGFAPSGSPVLRDRGSGSLFDLHGDAFAGPLAGHRVRLPQLSTFSAFWFAWSVFYPGSEIWGVDERVREATIASEADCDVPCEEIRRVLSRDGIPSLPNIGPPRGAPRFTTPGSADAGYLVASDLVIGLSDGVEARAYPHNILWWHEIVNETFGGQELSITFCPLTGSALVFSAAISSHGVSGNLYNSNLVMYDHVSQSLFGQLRVAAIAGSRRGQKLDQVPFVETTWARWLQMHPDTKVLSSETGSKRDYSRYPYGDYRTDHDDTFAVTNPLPDPRFPGKWKVTGVIAGDVRRAYVHEEIQRQRGSPVVFRDEVGRLPVWVVFDRPTRMLTLFHAGDPEFELDLEWAVAP